MATRAVSPDPRREPLFQKRKPDTGLSVQGVDTIAKITPIPGPHGAYPWHKLRVMLHVSNQAHQLVWCVGQHL